MPFIFEKTEEEKKKEEEERNKVPPIDLVYYKAIKDEGHHFAKTKRYHQAVGKLSEALHLIPTDFDCLLKRAHCYLNMGRPKDALADSIAALKLKERSTSIENARALYMKAEALFHTGDFENALICYHRGRCHRPLDNAIAVGIHKSQEAINNSIGTRKSVRLCATGDLSYFNEGLPMHHTALEKATRLRRMSMGLGLLMKVAKEKPRSSMTKIPHNAFPRLLGPLYRDLVFLESLYSRLRHKRKLVMPDVDTKTHVSDGLNYLKKRAEFWREHQPIYARHRDLRRAHRSCRTFLTPGDPLQYLLKQAVDVDKAQDKGDYRTSLKIAEKALSRLESYGKKFMQGRLGLVSNLYSSMGNASLELGLLEQAMEYHQKDLHVGKTSGVAEIKTRALDNIGRTLARMGRYEEAISVLTRKVGQEMTGIQWAWRHHEVGRCLLKLGRWPEAKEEGLKSLVAAEDINNQRWQMHALVLVGEAEAGMENTEGVVSAFERACDLAKTLQDGTAQAAIDDALLALNGQQEKEKETVHHVRVKELQGREDDEEGEEEEEECRRGGADALGSRSRIEEKVLLTTVEKETHEDGISEPEQRPESTQPDTPCEIDSNAPKSIISVQTGRIKSTKKVRIQTGKVLENEHTTGASEALQSKNEDTSDVEPLMLEESSSAEDVSQTGSSLSEDRNNSVLCAVEDTLPSSTEKPTKVQKDAKIKSMTMGKQYFSRKNPPPTLRSNRVSNEETTNIKFQLKRVSRPQTAKQFRPKLVINPRPDTATYPKRKPARTRKSHLSKSVKYTGTGYTEIPKPRMCWTTGKTDVITYRDHGVSPDADSNSDSQLSDSYQQENNSNSSVSPNLFNVSSSESSGEAYFMTSDYFHSGITSFPNASVLNMNSDDRRHCTDSFEDATDESKLNTLCSMSPADADLLSDDIVQTVTSWSNVPELGQAFTGEMSAATRSCYSLPHSPLWAGSDTQFLQAARPAPDSSSDAFYSDSRIKSWVADVQDSFSSPAVVSGKSQGRSPGGQDSRPQHHTVPHKPPSKGAKQKRAVQHTALAERIVPSGRACIPVAACPAPKHVTSSLLQQVYDPRRLSVRSAANETGRSSAQKRPLSRLPNSSPFKTDSSSTYGRSKE